MELIIGIIVGVVVLMLLVVVHELGHALVAKRHGVVVEEFGIGFPPRAWGRKLKKSLLGKNVLFSLNWLPLGGFVKLQGENDAADGKGDYGAASFWQKTQILLAGVAMNWAVAIVLFALLACTTGIPKLLPDQFHLKADTQHVTSLVELALVADGMPAAKAGLQSGDKIAKFDGVAPTSPEHLTRLAEHHKGKKVPVVYERKGVQHVATVAIRSDNTDKKGYFGVGPIQRETLRSTWSAPIVGVGTTVQMTAVTLQGIGKVLYDAVSGLAMKLSWHETSRQQGDTKLAEVGASVAGPVGIFGIIFPAAEQAGPMYVVMLAAIISLTLAVMNALPIPALDGGRWFVTAIYKLLRRPLTKEREEKIHGTGFMILMLLVILVTIADIGKF